MQRVTIREVARRAGVSHQTVSRVLNNSTGVAESTRAIVQKVIAELDYYPNAQAVSLSRDRSNTIGVVVESISSPFFSQIIQGTVRGLREHGRLMLLATTDSSAQHESIEVLQRSRRIDGLIIVLPVEASLEQARQLARGHLPVAMVDFQYDIDANYIAIDNFRGAYSAAEHLIKLGHRRIGIICGRADMPVSKIRLNGYQAALRDYGLPVDPALITQGNFTSVSGECCAAQLLALPDPPTAIFASNDEMALGVMYTLYERGMQVPRDMSIVGFDDIPETLYAWPPLTTVRQPLGEMGWRAGDYICRLIDGTETTPLRLILETRLVIRRSTALMGDTTHKL